MAKAERFLAATERSLEAEDWETAASRGYYAAYHAVIALVEARGRISRRRWDHSQLRGAFRSQFGARGYLFTARDATNFDKLYENRLAADYETVPVRRSIAMASIATARDLCARIRRMVEP